MEDGTTAIFSLSQESTRNWSISVNIAVHPSTLMGILRFQLKAIWMGGEPKAHMRRVDHWESDNNLGINGFLSPQSNLSESTWCQVPARLLVHEFSYLPLWLEYRQIFQLPSANTGILHEHVTLKTNKCCNKCARNAISFHFTAYLTHAHTHTKETHVVQYCIHGIR